MNRRGFIGSILALGAAPAIVRADSLMRIVPLDVSVVRLEDLIWDIAPIDSLILRYMGTLDEPAFIQYEWILERPRYA
jgi:hypothetical protein